MPLYFFPIRLRSPSGPTGIDLSSPCGGREQARGRTHSVGGGAARRAGLLYEARRSVGAEDGSSIGALEQRMAAALAQGFEVSFVN